MNSQKFHLDLNDVRKKAKQVLADWIEHASKSTRYIFRDDRAKAKAILIKLNRAYLKAIAGAHLASVEILSKLFKDYQILVDKVLDPLKKDMI